MFLHLPIVENRIAQFAARFERHGAGWVYHADGLVGGLPISDAEHADLIAEHARRFRRAERIMLVWLVVAVIGCAAYAIVSDTDPSDHPWLFAPILVLPMPWVAWEWHRADRLPLDLAGRRMAITGSRTRWQAARSRIAALPPGVSVMLMAIGVLLAVQSRPWSTVEQRWWLAEALLAILGGAAVLAVRSRERRRLLADYDATAR